MVDNRYATALVIAGVLSILATVYLSVAIGTQHWYQYSSPAVRGEANVSELRSLYEEFIDGEFDEKTYSDTLFRLNGTVSLWWRCVLVPTSDQWFKEPGMCAKIENIQMNHLSEGSRPPSDLLLLFLLLSVERGGTRCWSLPIRLTCAFLRRVAASLSRVCFFRSKWGDYGGSWKMLEPSDTEEQSDAGEGHLPGQLRGGLASSLLCSVPAFKDHFPHTKVTKLVCLTEQEKKLLSFNI